MTYCLSLARSLRLSAAMITLVAGLPAAGLAQAVCENALSALQVAGGGSDVGATLAAWKAVETSTCDDARIRAARSQASAYVARAAQGVLAAGDVNGAENIVLQAPGVHWAVQALRGDIAAKRGQRDEAARMYNAAIDTLGDPGQTVQSEALVPVAERLAQLAQENMMLAGSMDSAVTRGGGSSGVMAMASRGLAVEKIAAGVPPEQAYAAAAPVVPSADPAYVAPADPAYVAPADPAYVAPADPAYVPPADPGYVKPADPAYVPPADPGYVKPADPAYVPPADPAYVAPAAPTYVAPADPAYVAPAAPPVYQQQAYNVVTAAASKVDSVFLPIRFGFDSDQLDATGVREALRLSEFLKANQVGTLIITGHTDDVGSADYNLDLSLRRATTLARFLQSDHVLTRISVIGKGESEPPAYTDAGAYNIDELRTIARRVEVAFGY
jgi:outer membrane protein OmpA-like peptidoglycan-associated protein